MRASVYRALILPLLLAASSFAAETRGVTVLEPLVPIPVLSRETLPIDGVSRLAPLVTPVLAAQAIPPLPSVQIEATEAALPAPLAAGVPATAQSERTFQAQLNAVAGRTRGQQDQPSAPDTSHWAQLFDGIKTSDGNVAIPQAAGQRAVSADYLSETQGLGGAELLSKLHDITGRGAQIKHYKEAKSYMFERADHVERGGQTGLMDAYSGVFVAGTGPDGGKYAEQIDHKHDGYVDRGGMNVEHIWPQSFFGAAEPMRADLHHLMATFMHDNSERGNLPFGEVKGRPEYHNDAGAKMGGGVFEPPDLSKGRVARSLLYFYTRYYDKRIFSGSFGQKFWDDNLPMLLRWNRQFPPTAFERGRNDLVEKYQGNRNPFVDDQSLADRIGETPLKTGNRYGIRRGTANYGAAPAPALAPEHLIRGARMRPTPTKLGHPLRLIITGPPGAGKGTFSDKISAEYGVPHISVGELLREHAKAHPAVAAIMAKGQLVDTSLVLSVVRERLAQPDVRSRGFILDGFPRRAEEARALSAMLGPQGVDGVISLDVPDAELLRRILARGRADDSEPVFQERMKIYHEQTVPAVEIFTNSTPVIAPEVKSSDIETNYSRVKASLLGLLKQLTGSR
jgi:adenylate kinase